MKGVDIITVLAILAGLIMMLGTIIVSLASYDAGYKDGFHNGELKGEQSAMTMMDDAAYYLNKYGVKEQKQ